MRREFDLVVRNGLVVDGLGGPPQKSDVAVKDGLIVEVGDVFGRGTQEIDATDRLVTPGFVDIHTHYDGQATWDRYLTPSSLHGVTTAVMGNCGVGFAPVHSGDHQCIIELMEGVEDIPGTALHEGLTWNWSTFPEYLDALDRLPHDIDVCAQVPHGALRLYVMGRRALHHEYATADDVGRMRQLVTEALKAGAVGVSTSRTAAHRSITGELTPSIGASQEELLGIAQGIRDAGCGVLEAISDWQDERTHDFSIFRKLAEKTRVPISISLMQDGNMPGHWRTVLSELEKARAEGLPMLGQVAPRGVGLVMSLETSASPFHGCGSYQALNELKRPEKLRVLRGADVRERILAEFEYLLSNPQASPPSRQRNLELVFPMGAAMNYEPRVSDSIAAMARATGKRAHQVFYDQLLEGDGTAIFYSPIFNFAEGNYEACREMLSSNATVPGLGDAGAHVGSICDASFTTYLLSYWGRDRPHGRFDLAWLVKRLSADTARAVGLSDRGVVAPNMKADMNVIDFPRLRLNRPEIVYDLPAKGRRLIQSASGYDATIVSGSIIRQHGEPTHNLPGRLVRSNRHTKV